MLEITGVVGRRCTTASQSRAGPRNGIRAWVSGGAAHRAARATLAFELQAITQLAQAARTARVAELQVVGPAGARGFLLGVAGASVPDTFSEGHSGPSHAQIARKCRGLGASDVPGGLRRGDAWLAPRAPRGRELVYPVRMT